MKLDTFLTVAAILALLFGLGFLLIPAQVMSSYGITLDAAGQWTARYLGSAFLGVGAVTWLARKIEKGAGLRAIILGNLLLSITGLVVSVLDALFGVGNAFQWSTVIIYLFLAAGCSYFTFMKPVES